MHFNDGLAVQGNETMDRLRLIPKQFYLKQM
jgi:hypothetical protein